MDRLIGKQVSIWTGQYKGSKGTVIGVERSATPPFVDFYRIELQDGRVIIELYDRLMF